MPSTLITYPDDDLAGDWEGTQPTPVDAVPYTEPTILGVDTAGYLSGDSNADSDISEALTLPSIGISGGGSITFVGSSSYDGSSTFSTTHSVPLPSVSILAGDHIEVLCQLQESTPPGSAATSTGYTQSFFLTASSTSFRPEITKLYKTAVGGESGNITVTIPDADRLTVSVTVWRGVDQTTPYDATQVGTISSLDPPSITTVTDNAVVLTHLVGNDTPPSSVTFPSGYSIAVDINPSLQQHTGYKTVATAGAENPGAYVWASGPENYRVITHALRPASAVDISAIVVTVQADTTATTELGGSDLPVLSGATFTLKDSIQIPRSGTWRPQAHIWSAPLTAYSAGDTIDITVGTSDGIHSWAAILLIVDSLDTATIIQDIGTEMSGYSQVAQFGSVTPSTNGAKILAFAFKTPSGWHYDTAPNIGAETPLPSVPVGYTQVAQAESDAIVATAYLSTPVPASEAQTPSSPSWSALEDWTTGLVTLKPDVASSSGGDLYEVVNSTSTAKYIEIAAAAGTMDEVLELDLASVPTDGIITGVSIQVVHQCAVQNALRVELVGINSDDTRVNGGELKVGYLPSSLTETSTIDTGFWTQLDDGTNLHDYTRLGVRLFSTNRAPGLSSHKIYSVAATIEYEEGGPVVSAVAGPATAGDPITWVFSSAAGLAQTHSEVMVIQGTGQDPTTATTADNPLDASDGEIVYRSGKTAGPLTRSLTIPDAPLSRGVCTYAVRAWSRLSNGSEVVSDWATANLDITGAGPTSVAQPDAPVLNAASGCVDLTIDIPASCDRVWVLRSVDSGATYTVVKSEAVTASASNVTVSDHTAPLAATGLRWQVAFDNGANTETSTVTQVGSGDTSTPITEWYMMAASDPSLNFSPDVAAGSFRLTNLRESVTVSQPGNTLSVSSAALGARISMVVRTITPAQRASLEALVALGEFRLVNILGQEWNVKIEGNDAPELMIVQPGEGETTQLRDAFLWSLNLVEVAS